MKGVVLCAGEGTRMRPLTYSQPKHLVPIANRPVIEWILDTISSAGISDIAVVVSPGTESAFREALGDGQSLGVNLSYVVQEQAKGLAHAVHCAERFVAGEPFLLYLGDNLFERGVGGLIDVYTERDCAAAISLAQVEDPRRFGVACLEAGRITRLIEKPENPPSDLAVAGAYIFEASIFDCIRRIQPSARGELEITDAIQLLVKDGKRAVLPHRVEGWWEDVGRPHDMLLANELLLRRLTASLRNESKGPSGSEGTVLIDPSAKVERSKIIGPGVLGSGTRVKDAVIGPNVAVGKKCVLEDCRVEHSILMDGASVRGLEYVGFSILGYRAAVTKAIGGSGTALLLGNDSSVRIQR